MKKGVDTDLKYYILYIRKVDEKVYER